MSNTRPELYHMVDWDALLSDERIKLYMTPELPKATIKVGKTEYKVTDMRLLDKTAVEAFGFCVTEAVNDRNAEECVFVVGRTVTDDGMYAIETIVTGVEYRAQKKGRGGFSSDSHILTSGLGVLTKADGSREVHVDLIPEHVQVIHDYAKTLKDGEPLQFNEIVMRIAEDSRERLTAFLKKEAENDTKN